MDTKEFKINIPHAQIRYLKVRLAKTRWPWTELTKCSKKDADRDLVKDLCDYWQRSFNWSKQEHKLNEFNHFQSGPKGSEFASFMKKEKELRIFHCC